MNKLVVTKVQQCRAMIGENWKLVSDAPVEVKDCKKITDHFTGMYRIYPNLIKENGRM